MKKEFILTTLLPYKENPNTCSFSGDQCLYLASNGNKCAVGKHMKKGPWQKSFLNIAIVIGQYGKETIFTEEALNQKIPISIWAKMQKYHDSISDKLSKIDINRIVKELEDLTGFTFIELYY